MKRSTSAGLLAGLVAVVVAAVVVHQEREAAYLERLGSESIRRATRTFENARRLRRIYVIETSAFVALALGMGAGVIALLCSLPAS